MNQRNFFIILVSIILLMGCKPRQEEWQDIVQQKTSEGWEFPESLGEVGDGKLMIWMSSRTAREVAVGWVQNGLQMEKAIRRLIITI